MIERILQILEGRANMTETLVEQSNRIYDNKAIMALLGIKDKLLKRLRDNGYLGYSRHGDKYWYTQEDVDTFLRHCHYKAFASVDGSLYKGEEGI